MAERTILIADDDENVHEILSLYLKKENYEVLSAYDGEEALAKAEEKPDLLVLDIMMPKLDGKEVIKELRKDSQVPIIFLSAKGEEFDRVLGLELGADDYVTKPFSPRELAARIKAILKRTKRQSSQTDRGDDKSDEGQKLITYPELKINPQERRVVVRGEVIDLSPKEYDLLLMLASRPRQVFERERLYESVWGIDSYGSLRSVDVHINWLRDKLSLGYIKTVWGVGYKFEVNTDED
jgi:two-component system response regulator ResD